jgi:hypothetical protein
MRAMRAKASGRSPGDRKPPPMRANPKASTLLMPSACASVRARPVTSVLMPATATTVARITTSTPSGSPQSAPRTTAVTSQITRNDTSPTRTTLAVTPARMARSEIGVERMRASVPSRRSTMSVRAPAPSVRNAKRIAIDGAK